MDRFLRRGVLSMVVLSLAATGVGAVDRPIDGKRLVYRDRGTPAKSVLTFVASDPDMLVPAAGVYGDPSATGLSIYLLTRNETLHLRIPGSAASPGWRVRQASRDTYIYKGSSVGNDDTLKLLWRQGGLLKLRVRGVQLASAGPFEGISIRIDFALGSNCTVFTGTAIRRDEEGVFAGAAALAGALADCRDASIVDALTPCGLSEPQCGGACPEGSACGPTLDGGCACVSGQQPCGDTAPVCNGQCPSGEECFTTNADHPFLSCICSPSDQIPCGAAGGSACPIGSSCQRLPGRETLYGDYWRCIDDDAVCGEPGFGSCGPAGQCVMNPPLSDPQYTCLPIFCGGSYPGGPFPACNTSCPPGLRCAPLSAGGINACVCTLP